ncbi:MAG TPA: hypothetical protein VF223_07045 [Trebonia sp.]
MTPREQAQQFLDQLRAHAPGALGAPQPLPPAVVKDLKDWIDANRHERTTLFPERAEDPRVRAEMERIADRAAAGDSSGVLHALLAEEQKCIEKALATRVTVKGKAPDIGGRTLVGFLGRGQVNAASMRVPGADAYLIVFDEQMLLFTHHLSSALALAAPRSESADSSDGVAFTWDRQDIGGRIKAHPEIADRFADIVATYARTGRVGLGYGGAGDRLPLGYSALAHVLNISLSYFVLGHEYGHIVLGHPDMPAPDVMAKTAAAAGIEVPANFTQAYLWAQEWDADLLGMKLALTAGINYGRLDLPTTFMGVGLFFAAMDVMDRAVALLQTGDENASQLGSHPPSDSRRRQLREALAKMADDELAHDARKVEIALELDEAEAETIRLLWERTRPVLADLHRRGVAAARTWRTIPKETG